MLVNGQIPILGVLQHTSKVLRVYISGKVLVMYSQRALSIQAVAHPGKFYLYLRISEKPVLTMKFKMALGSLFIFVALELELSAAVVTRALSQSL